VSVAEHPLREQTVPRWRADASLMLLALVWGGTFVVVKTALRDISTMYFLALRFGLAAVCLGLLFANKFRTMGRTQLLCGLRAGFLVGILLWLGFALQTWGLEYTSAGNSGFLTGLYIVLVPLFSAALYRRWPRAAELIGISIAGVGLVLLTAPSTTKMLSLNRGDLLTIGCAIVFAVHLLALGYFSQRERFEAVAIGQVACTALISMLGLMVERPRVSWHPQVILAIVVTGVLATAVAFALQTWAQQYTTPTRTALILSLEPVFAFAAAVLVAGEALILRSVVGGGLIIAGILVVELRRAE
jgi:drug/metabolite transporter (DMT)-like permease